MDMSLKLVRIFLLLCVAGGAAADGKLYRWVDSSGGVHYSDQPVASAREIPVKTVPGTDGGQQAAVPSAKPYQDTSANAAQCQQKRDQLGSYRTANKVSETDGLGNTRDYTPEERQKLIEITEKAVHDLCGNS